jgi:hypothetical protein
MPGWTRPLVLLLTAAPAAAAEDAAARIEAGFRDLGMAEAQAACYARVLDAELDAEGAREAAALVEGAESSEALRGGVKDAGLAMVAAFLAAETECGR